MGNSGNNDDSGGLVVESGIAKFPSGRMPGAAAAEAEAAYGRAPCESTVRIGRSTPLAEVNAMAFAPGTTVLFERGGVWRGQLQVRSGVPGHPIRYGAFGDGPAPVFQPSRDLSAAGAWSREKDGLWRAGTGAAADIGNVILDGGASGCLFKRGSRAECLRDGDFWCDPASLAVFVRSESGSPATRWQSIEAAEKIHCIDEACAHDVEYDGLALRFGAAHGFGGGDVKRVAIRDCDISWIGGGYLYVDTLGNGVRYGNGIELWGGAEDVLVEKCRVRQCWDAGLTNQSNMPGSVERNIVWRECTVSACEYSYEFWQQGEGGAVEGVRLENNVFRDAGAGWGHAQRWNPNAAHLMLYDTTAHTPGFVVEGNVFSRSTDVLCRMFNDWRGEAVFRGNRWESGGEAICRYHGRPRRGLRYNYPDRLDQIHDDNASEIESQGAGARSFAATQEDFAAFEYHFGFGPDTFQTT